MDERFCGVMIHQTFFRHIYKGSRVILISAVLKMLPLSKMSAAFFWLPYVLLLEVGKSCSFVIC
ncbi:hypothetical protein T08_15707 [Trichinella sp. T8]|nr:hypothetical protein T08_15707 [Trichinella sp. T8]